jgi:hypothetical protein
VEDLADAVVDITKGRADIFHGEACHVADGLFCPADLSDDLVIRQGCQTAVRPGLCIYICVCVLEGNGEKWKGVKDDVSV